MKAIIEKELKSYFLTPRGYVFIGVFVLLSSYFFITYNVLNNNADLGVMLENTVVTFILVIPILTMGLFAGEKRNGTDKLYFSAPLHKWEIVLGKYLASAIVFVCAVLINFLSAIVMMFFKGQTFGEIFAIYTGFILLGLAFISVGMFLSSMTDNQILSAIISFCACFVLYLSDWLLDVTSNPMVKMLAITNYYSNFILGIFDFKAVIYFVSFSALFILLTILHIEKTEAGSKRKLNVLLIAVSLIVSFFLINACGEMLSKKVQFTFDMSKNKIFELSEDTERYLDSVDKDIQMYYLIESGRESPYVAEVLGRYEKASSAIKIQNVDMIKNPSFAAKYAQNGETLSKGSVIIESNEKFTIVEPSSALYVNKDEKGNVSRELGFSLESKLTQAIDYVLKDKTLLVECLTNHGEENFNDPISILRNENIQTEYSDNVSESVKKADLIVIFAPLSDISDQELRVLNGYLDNGGKLLVSLNPGIELPNISALVNQYALTMEHNVLTVDHMSDVIANNRLYLMTYPAKHESTAGIDGQQTLIFPVASSILTGTSSEIKTSKLAVTDKNTSARVLASDSIGEKLSTGEFTVAALAEHVTNNSAVLLTSSSQFLVPADNSIGDVLRSYNYCNKEFFVQSVKYLIGEKNSTLIASPKSIMSRSLNLNAGTKMILIVVFGIIFPLTAFILGFLVFRRRRHM